MKKIVMLIVAAMLIFACGSDDGVSSTTSGNKTVVEGTWEESEKNVPDEDGYVSPKFVRIKFSGDNFYQNQVDVEDDGSERVEWIGAGSFSIDSDSIYLTYTSAYESHGGYEFSQDFPDGETFTESVPFTLPGDELNLAGTAFSKTTESVMMKP